MNIAIYGAQGIALGVYKALKELHQEINVLGFIVTEIENNPSNLDGILVYKLSDFASEMTLEEKENVLVLIATPENAMEEIEENLDLVKMRNHVRIDAVRWAKMQELRFTKNGEFNSINTYPVGSKMPLLNIYKVIHHKDKSLQMNFSNPNYMTSLQVGAANTDIRVGELTDDLNDNISLKNGNYSELTGLYWIWKNRLRTKAEDKGAYTGMVHYRRLFDITEDNILTLMDNDIDVVLPYPMPYEPDIEEHHKRYLSDNEWNSVLEALKELDLENYDEYMKILKQGYLYNYNIIIAKDNVLGEYCSWLFPILFRTEQINNEGVEKKPNRYIGYIAETLETLYFMRNKDKLKIAHMGYRFLT
ncbi:MAG: DUF4422 domain-containing protein [Agathobacter sp.]|nr:DUF4422 domain-containing protein [Agathobacter sp.]